MVYLRLDKNIFETLREIKGQQKSTMRKHFNHVQTTYWSPFQQQSGHSSIMLTSGALTAAMRYNHCTCCTTRMCTDKA